MNLRRVRVVEVEEPGLILQTLPIRRPYFTLLLAWDAGEVDISRLSEIFGPLVARGLAYFCAWGNGCEAVHDACDGPAAERERQGDGLSYTTMTTWHAGEPLSEAMWYFDELAIPAERHILGDFDRFAVAVGNRVSGAEMREYFASPIRPRPALMPMRL